MTFFGKYIGNLYLACLIFQIVNQYRLLKDINHGSLLLKSIDEGIDYLYISNSNTNIPNSNINIPNSNINISNSNTNISNTLDTCPYRLKTYSNQLYQHVEYIGIYSMTVISLEFMLIHSKIQYLYICLCILFIHYSIIWKELLLIWNIPAYHEYIWLAIATICFTTLSNSLKSIKKKKEKLIEQCAPLQLNKIELSVLYNYVFIIAIINIILLGILSNQHVLLITLWIYLSNIILDPQYFVCCFEIGSLINIFVNNLEYNYLAGLSVCYFIFLRYDIYNRCIKQNITTLLSIKIVGIFFQSFYRNFLCKY